jgi:hydrogenase nickel incorporation protein HypB
MCQECGCGLGAGTASVETHGSHGAGHDHPHVHPSTQVLKIQQSLLDRNQRLAERNRGYFRAKRLLVLNVVSAPGSGKTALIGKTGALLRGRFRVGAIVGDLETDNDARRLREAGLPVVQITTGTLCHLEAEMVARAFDAMDLDHLDILIIENVGNLVCPAAYDLGEHLRVVLLSVTEGEDKPLKYPPLFHSADLVLISKIDIAEAAGFNRTVALANLQRVSHHASILEVSSRTGEGMDSWLRYLEEQIEAVRL